MWGWLHRLLGRDEPAGDIATARTHAERALMAVEGVASVGIGLDDQGREAIVIGVDDEKDAVAQAMPTEVDGVPVTVRTQSKLRAEEVEGP